MEALFADVVPGAVNTYPTYPRNFYVGLVMSDT